MMLRTIISAAAVAAVFAVSAQRIAVLSDIHVGKGAPTDSALRAAVVEINAAPFDVVVVDGDLATEGSDAELTYVKSILDQIKHPLCMLPGNHETTWSQSATKTFVDLWGNDRFVTEVDSLILIGISSGPYMKMGNGCIKSEDLHWLDATLAERTKEGKRVLSFCHYPLNNDLDNLSDYMAILEKYPVIGHVNGHYHSWQEYKAAPESGSDLPCVMVRSLSMGKKGSATYGYSEIEVDPQWVHIYNKEIGKARQPRFAFANKKMHKKAKFEPMPEVVAPQGYEVTQVWADSASVFTRPAVDADNVYFGTSTGMSRAVDKKSDQLRWCVPVGASVFSRATVLPGGKVAVPVHDGILILDAATGRQLGKHKSKEGPYVADGLMTPDGKAYIQGGYKRMEKRRPSDGKLIWSYDSINNYCQAAAVADGDDLVFGAWDTKLRCLDLKKGRLRWEWTNGSPVNLFSPGNVVPVVTNDKVIIVAPDRYMTAIDRATGRQIWRDKSHRYRESMGRSEDGTRVYAKTMDGELVAVDVTGDTFKELWTIDLGLGYEHAPCVIVEKDGIVYTGSLRGKVTMTRAADHKLVASLQLGKTEVNGIDIDPSTGDIYVSLIEGKIYRIAKK